MVFCCIPSERCDVHGVRGFFDMFLGFEVLVSVRYRFNLDY